MKEAARKDLIDQPHSAAFYLAIIDAIRDPLMVINQDMLCIYMNQVARDTLEIDDTSYRNCACFNVLRNLDDPCWELGEACPVREAFATGETVRIVKEMCLHPTLKRTYEISAVPIRDDAGAITEVVELLRDVTASHDHMHLRDLSRKIEKAKKEWETTMDCIQEFVILADAQQKIKRCNRPLTAFLDLSFQDILGQELPVFLGAHGFRQELCLIADREFEYRHQPSGRFFTLASSPLTIDKERMSVTTLHDITHRKEAARVLEQKNVEIQQALDDLQATQAKLLQQEKMASVGQLAAGVAHEINNPIGFVTSNINTLAKYYDKVKEFVELQDKVIAATCTENAASLRRLSEQRHKLKIDFIFADIVDLISESSDGVERVKKIVMSLKNFSRVDQAERLRANINDCLDDTISIAWNELKYTCTIHKEYGELPALICHPQQLNQVFMNILVNAAQAMEEPGIITIKTWQEDQAIFIAISDTGSGMEPTQISRAFDPFYTTKEVGKGTGLGLSISYDIITKGHHGEISIQSEPGQGSTFTICLPLATEEES